jgi:hypothetical protein
MSATRRSNGSRSPPYGSATNEPVGKIAERMRRRGASAVLVTTSDGSLVGLLYREDAEHLGR